MEKITTEKLSEILLAFDKDLEIDEAKIAELSDKQKSELYLAIKKILRYKEDFPSELANAVQTLAKQSVEKQSIEKQSASFGLNPDEDGIVLDDGSILEPDDELFPLVKKLLKMDEQEITEYVDNIVDVVVKCCALTAIILLKKKLGQKEQSKAADNKDNGNWPTVTKQL